MDIMFNYLFLKQYNVMNFRMETRQKIAILDFMLYMTGYNDKKDRCF